MATASRQRQSQKQSKKPSRFRALFLPIFSALVAASFVTGGVFLWRWLEKPTTFPITHIVVEGEYAHVANESLQKTIQANLAGGFFSLHLRVIRNALLMYPWIETVSFRRVWPNTLRVRLLEHVALARFGTNCVLSLHDQVFCPELKTIPQNLPLINAPVDQAMTVGTFYQNASALAKLIGTTINVLTVNAEKSWSLELSNGVKVELGRQEPLKRFTRFIAVYPKIINSSKESIVSVDLRYPDGMAVQFSASSKAVKK